MNKQAIICVVAGKSGGHIVPAITYASFYIDKNPDSKLLFFSSHTQLDHTITALYPVITFHVPLVIHALPGYKLNRYPAFIGHFLQAFGKSFRSLYRLRPQKVISMGGYVSLPVCLAAWLLRIPVELFELNATPGKAITWLTLIARKIHVCFPQAQRFFSSTNYNVTPYPLRFSNNDKRISKVEACRQLGLNPALPLLVVLGGSQGSQFINALIIRFIHAYQAKISSLQIVHQTGYENKIGIQALYKKYTINARIVDYTSSLHLFYAAADVVIARAGAGTLFELAFFQKKSIIIPLETKATAHQVDNALAMVEMEPTLFTIVRQSQIEQGEEFFFNLVFKSFKSLL